jgi:hypothetical protein
MSKRNRCRITEHDDAPLGRGSKRVRCRKCGDTFPCGHACAHLDCMIERDELHLLPERLPWITEVSQ